MTSLILMAVLDIGVEAVVVSALDILVNIKVTSRHNKIIRGLMNLYSFTEYGITYELLTYIIYLIILINKYYIPVTLKSLTLALASQVYSYYLLF
tara:strand:- start:79750 stop:80034 length:285 start_codon:yes stop_codon:yes gene_type:complete